MGIETPKTPTPEEMAEINKERIKSDAELVKEGAEVTPDGRIKPTEEEIKDAEEKMEHNKNRRTGEKFLGYKTVEQLTTDDMLDIQTDRLIEKYDEAGLTHKEAEKLAYLKKLGWAQEFEGRVAHYTDNEIKKMNKLEDKLRRLQKSYL